MASIRGAQNVVADDAGISRIVFSGNSTAGPVRCDNCDECFKCAVNLEQHRIIHFEGLLCCCRTCRNEPNTALTCGENTDKEILASIGYHYDKFFKCIRCGRRFQLRVELQLHNAMRHHKPHTGEHCCRSCRYYSPIHPPPPNSIPTYLRLSGPACLGLNPRSRDNEAATLTIRPPQQTGKHQDKGK